MYTRTELKRLVQPFDSTTTVYKADWDEVYDPATGNILHVPAFPPDLGASVADEERLIKGCENIIEFYDTRYLEMVNDSSLDPELKKDYLRRADYEKWLAISRYVRANAPMGW